MKTPDAHGFGGLNSHSGTLDVGNRLSFFVGAHVVNRRQVEEMIHPSLQSLDNLRADTQVLTGQVTDNCLYPTLVDTPALPQLIQLAKGLLPYQQMYCAAPGQQFLYQKTADKTGAACQEIIHRSSILPVAFFMSTCQRA